MTLRSHLRGIVWPAVPSQRGAALLSMLNQLATTQWWSADRLLEHQLLQLRELLHHTYNTVPFYRRRFDAVGFRPGGRLTLDEWRTLPLLTRRDIQSAADAMVSTSIPATYGGVMEMQTSGSTGEPVKVRGTGVDQLMWEVMTLRDHDWHQRELSAKLALIRVFVKGGGEPPDGTVSQDWGPPASELYATGPTVLLSLMADIGTQARWLMQHEPEYLLTYPTNLAALITHFAERGYRLHKLRQVRTIGETVTPALRAACRDHWGVPLVDAYSSQELGYIALQCPESEQYHVMAESVLVEIIGADGIPCRPGEVGKLIISRLHDYATPLIRYELGDYAEASAPCPCGRGLPTIGRILGRSRNMLTLPGGEQRWPLVGFDRYREIAPIRQYQLIQHTLLDIEVRFVVDRSLTRDEEARLTQVIQGALGYPFRLQYVYFSGEIPRARNGKFEEFVSKLAA